MKNICQFTLTFLALLPLTGLTQTATEINPFARQFVTAEQMTQQVPPPPNTPTPTMPVAVMPQPAQLDTTRPTAYQAKPLADAARTAPSAAPVAPPAPPRFIPEGPRNTGSQIYFEGRGEAKEGHYGNTYGQPALRPNSTGMRPDQVKMLAPLLSELRAQGVEEGKISIELNRLTPAQFAHWARQVLQ